MICDVGDVVVVPFPFVDVAAEKRRPSLILSHNHPSGAPEPSPEDIRVSELAAEAGVLHQEGHQILDIITGWIVRANQIGEKVERRKTQRRSFLFKKSERLPPIGR